MRLIDADALDTAFTNLRFNQDMSLAHWGDRKDWCLHGHEVEKLIHDAPTIGGWISVKDRLPDRDNNYLVTAKLSYGSDPWYVCIATYRHVHPDCFGCFGILNEKDGQMYRGAVTHWMPLPEPQREGEAG